MYPFSNHVTPAARNHAEAQVSFFNDVTKSVFHSFQQMCDLNIQLAQTLLEETTRASHQLFLTERQHGVIGAAGAAASRAQPTAEKLRSYQQHLSRIAADSQVELARVTEEHVSETSRTARALAEEVQRTASEETERSRNTQQEAMRDYRDPFADGAQRREQQSMRAGASMQSEGQSASMQGGAAQQQGGAQAQAKPGSTPRKET